jgi:hypothetical protein
MEMVRDLAELARARAAVAEDNGLRHRQRAQLGWVQPDDRVLHAVSEGLPPLLHDGYATLPLRTSAAHEQVEL